MTISSEITRISTNIANAYDACETKGATIPATENSANLAATIGTITELKGETKTVTPTTSQQTITPSSGKNGITQVTVNAVTSSIDANITAGNIKSGVSILGVSGNLSSANNTSLSITPTTSAQSFSPSSPYTGYNSVSVSAVTKAIDSNIKASNIKQGVNILGVNGTYSGPSYSGIPKANYVIMNDGTIENITDCNGAVIPALETSFSSYLLWCRYQNNNDIKIAVFGCMGPFMTTKYGYGLAEAFSYSTSIQHVYLPSVKSDIVNFSSSGYANDMLLNTSNVTVHLPSNIKADFPVITNGFSGTNTTVLFDLPPTSY